MSCQNSSPSSPNRGHKMPKQSSSSLLTSSSTTTTMSQWNDCNSCINDNPTSTVTAIQQQSPINFYDSSNYEQSTSNFSRTSKNLQEIQQQQQQTSNTHNTKRKINKPLNVICQNDIQNLCSPKTLSSLNNFNMNSPPIATAAAMANNKFENAPRSPKITTTYADDDDNIENIIVDDNLTDDCSNDTFYQNPRNTSLRTTRNSPKQLPQTSNYYYDSQNQSSSPKNLHSNKSKQRKFTFDAISPSYETRGKAFEYYEPISPDYDVPQQPQPQQSSIINQLHSQDDKKSNCMKRNTGMGSNSSGGGGGYQIKSRTMLPQSPDNCSNFIMNSNKRIPYDSSIGESSKQYYVFDDTKSSSSGARNIYMKRDSCVTEMTQFTNDSYETNVSTNTATTSLSNDSPKQRKESCDEMSSKRTISTTSDKSGNNVGSLSSCDDGLQMTGRNRRDAINIISNPGYQVLHSSHSTLDRTCSDSVFSLRCRKSTSDLTKVDTNDGSVPSLTNKKPRRRGSSKGGLAYLANRRNSRDSVKSACSNTSNFSNENIGPLAFQASARSRTRRTSNFLELPIPDHVRPRVCSLPDRPYNPRISDDLYRLRHFSISKGNVVNCGDSIISRRSRSNTSVNSTNSRASERSPFEFDGSCCGGGYANVDSMPPSPTENSEEPPPPPRYRIVMLGDASVGKTALVSQFMTSEYMHTYDASLDDEFGEKTVSILLDDEESELVFIDHPSVEMSVENSLSTYEPHACVVVYSVVDRNSFRIAEDIINYLWKENITKTKAVILVGNKADLARSRSISSTDGKNLAASRDAKFIETSSGIQHNVDELLVGALKQIRLKEKRDKKRETKMKTSRTHISLYLAKEILQKICLTDITKSKSCENLHVL